MVQAQRTIPILPPPGNNLRWPLIVFQTGERQPSALYINGGNPLPGVTPHRVCHLEVKGQLTAQMTRQAIHLIGSACQGARRNRYHHGTRCSPARGRRCFCSAVETRGQPATHQRLRPGPASGRVQLAQALTTDSPALQCQSALYDRRGDSHSPWKEQTCSPCRSQAGQGNTGISRVEEGIALNESNTLVPADG